MSSIEEILDRIKGQPGVEGEGLVLRRSMSQEVAEKYAKTLNELTSKACHVTRDLNPKDNLKNLRIRTRTKELIISHDTDFIVAVIQQWMPYSNS